MEQDENTWGFKELDIQDRPFWTLALYAFIMNMHLFFFISCLFIYFCFVYFGEEVWISETLNALRNGGKKTLGMIEKAFSVPTDLSKVISFHYTLKF